MATVTPNYAASATVTIGLATTPLASSTTVVREGTVIDNTTNKYDDALLSGKITVGTTPTSGTPIYVYVYAILDDTPTYPDTLAGSDADRTLTSVGVGQGFLKVAAVLNVDSTTSNRAYAFGPIAVAQFFGGVLPLKWGVAVSNQSGVALNSTAGLHFIKYIGVKYDVA